MSYATDRFDQREALQYITDGFPEYVSPYIAAAGDIGATLYEDLPGPSGYHAVNAELPPVGQLGANGRYVLMKSSQRVLEGVVTRLVNNGVRDATFANLAAEYGDPAIIDHPAASLGTRWARYASSNACGFCRVMATRGAVYRSDESATRVGGRSIDLSLGDRRQLHQGQGFTPMSELNPVAIDQALERRSNYVSQREAAKAGKAIGDKKTRALRGNRKYGDKFHDHCHCIAVAVRPGSSYEPPDYVQQWEKDYQDAVGAAREAGETLGEYGAIDIRAVARRMDNAEGGSGPQRRQGSALLRQQRKDGAQPAPGGGGPPDPGGPGGKKPGVGGGGPQGPDPKWLRTSRAHANGLTGRYRESVVDYTGNGHERINQWLRRGQVPADPSVAAKVKDIDAVLGKNPVTQPTVLTRTIDMQDTFKIARGEDLAKIVGTQRIEHGFMSTTRLPDGGATKAYKAPVRLTVHVPPGTPAAAIEDVSKFPGQGEILLGRGLGYTIVNPTYDSQLGMWRATMLIQPGGGTR
ncbi:hypothetical protein FZI85_25105 [Mycobacterium sp. CBMA293]|uniref:VG15 protein n=1 Tax=unclassified Mycolicibacterium TaxID=2636767 RepID=UPI0012DDC666|nr:MULTISPECIES: ADP-ribosyltransferase [unclassified Mycolicibacterium]MUL47596.1 hypothetical protein [Mycolicibacterium sp. CBMA 360]MUL61886.1 hypothetical protein [Mycolicibacterium sp. CBMA 335]MUL68959.1 hypothetical protein [Mycolicibacterium sp. CBMA 311]MUL92824.1 hypothetical protein [Mycolicibacterium sp. CBMA 230]MUM14288.1 hypothetical protein [Mycolicibacterium sp. CBMA 293]